ncbi:thiamine ABC transporter ATP-binding protein [Marinomonas epiphytica]
MLSIDLSYNWAAFEAHYQVTLEPGITTLLGGSGEGKSTLLQLIGGFLQGKGVLNYYGLSLLSQAPYERPISTLFQSDNLFPQLTVWQNVAVGLSANLRLSTEQKQKVSWALEQTQLVNKQNAFPQALSGGQAQRVAIARVLVREQPILLLDEPFSALDPALRQEMLLLIKKVTEEYQLTTLLVSHLPQEARLVGGRFLLIRQGKVVLHDRVEVLESSKVTPVLQDYLGSNSLDN